MIGWFGLYWSLGYSLERAPKVLMALRAMTAHIWLRYVLWSLPHPWPAGCVCVNRNIFLYGILSVRGNNLRTREISRGKVFSVARITGVATSPWGCGLAQKKSISFYLPGLLDRELNQGPGGTKLMLYHWAIHTSLGFLLHDASLLLQLWSVGIFSMALSMKGKVSLKV